MNHELPPEPPHDHITRRDLLARAITGMAAIALPSTAAAQPSPPTAEPEFVPENDYPFFGAEPGSERAS